MISLSKIVASVVLASVLAAGSAYAVLSPTGERLPLHNHFAVPFTQGFATRDVAICATGGAATNVAATFENRWNGQWIPVIGDLSRLARTSCINIWAQFYLNSPESQPSSAQALNLSTLPLMR